MLFVISMAEWHHTKWYSIVPLYHIFSTHSFLGHGEHRCKEYECADASLAAWLCFHRVCVRYPTVGLPAQIVA